MTNLNNSNCEKNQKRDLAKTDVTIVIVTVVIVTVVTVVMVTVVTVVIVTVVLVLKGTIVIVTVEWVTLVTMALVMVVIVTYFSQNNLTPRQQMRYSQGSFSRFSRCFFYYLSALKSSFRHFCHLPVYTINHINAKKNRYLVTMYLCIWPF